MVAAMNAANFCELVTDDDAPLTNTFQFPRPCLANLVYFFKGDCLQVLGFRNNLSHVFTGGKTRLTGEINYMSAYIPGA